MCSMCSARRELIASACTSRHVPVHVLQVHGSQNANIMFMRAGTSFMELNPHKFFYSSYETLATVSRVRFLR